MRNNSDSWATIEAEQILEGIMHRQNWSVATRDALANRIAKIVRRETGPNPQKDRPKPTQKFHIPHRVFKRASQ